MSTPVAHAAWLERLYPLSLVSSQYRSQLEDKLLQVKHAAGDTLLKSQERSRLYHYLLSGSIEVRVSFADRSIYDFSDQDAWCLQPLEELLKDGGSIRATSLGEMLVVSADYIDELLAYSQAASLGVSHLASSGEQSNDSLLGDQFEDEWTDIFCQKPLALQLHPSTLHELFRRLEDREVAAGELIIKENSEGHEFYVIKKGSAEVSCGSGGGLKEVIDLRVGDYFGDESLVAHTPRNASVRMMSPGLLGCLDEDTFLGLVGPALIRSVNVDALEKAGEVDWQWVDVRLPLEFRHGHREGSVNYPISSLRKRLGSLDPSLHYIIDAEGGRRSELATYLMCQAGLDAYLQVPSNVADKELTAG